jgi:hypothetical protein
LSSYTLPDFIRKLPGREPLSEIAIVVSGSRNSMANIRLDIDLTTIRYYEQVTIQLGKKFPRKTPGELDARIERNYSGGVIRNNPNGLNLTEVNVTDERVPAKSDRKRNNTEKKKHSECESRSGVPEISAPVNF